MKNSQKRVTCEYKFITGNEWLVSEKETKSHPDGQEMSPKGEEKENPKDDGNLQYRFSFAILIFLTNTRRHSLYLNRPRII